MATAPGAFGSTIWTTGISQSASVAGSGQPGYHGTVAGAVAGIDVPVATSLVPGLVVGVAIGGAATNTATGGSTEDGSLVQFAAYGGAQFGRVFVDGQASYLHVDRGVRRDVGVVNGSSVGSGQANGGGGSVEGGVRLTYAAWTIEPVLALSALSLKTGAIAESGGVADVRIGAQSLGSLQSLAAARVERSFGIGPTQIVHATATLGWQHEFLDVAPKSAVSFASFGTPLSVAAAPISRDAAVLGAGFDVPVTSAVAVYASYRQVLGDRSSSENATAGLRVVW
jgi:outer membrane autotransporter protein